MWGIYKVWWERKPFCSGMPGQGTQKHYFDVRSRCLYLCGPWLKSRYPSPARYPFPEESREERRASEKVWGGLVFILNLPEGSWMFWAGYLTSLLRFSSLNEGDEPDRLEDSFQLSSSKNIRLWFVCKAHSEILLFFPLTGTSGTSGFFLNHRAITTTFVSCCMVSQTLLIHYPNSSQAQSWAYVAVMKTSDRARRAESQETAK